MRAKPMLCLLASLIFACGGDGGGGGGIDASNPADGGGGNDADPNVDAGPLPACAEDLAPLADNSNAVVTDPNIVIAEVDPGTFIEVYNSGTTDVMLSTTGYVWCNNHSYRAFTQNAIVVKAGGRRSINWPVGSGTETSGDVVIYRNGNYSDGAQILDYVCWGTLGAATTNRYMEATSPASEKWVGACAPSIPAGGTIVRRPNTMGTSAADYETQATPTREDCE